VPVKKGGSPRAPDGGHTTQAGAPLGGAPDAVADPPPGEVRDEIPVRVLPPAPTELPLVPIPAELDGVA
jgi:hypothetical protein